MNWERVWILGNGPSRKTFDTRRLLGESVIAINQAFYDGPACDAFFSLDRPFIESHLGVLRKFAQIGGEVYIGLPERWPEIPGAEFFTWSYAHGLSDDPKVLCSGFHSGYGAVNLAYLKGAKEIHLVGYDLDPKDQKSTQQFCFWSEEFNTMLPQLEAKNVKVFNHNVHSFITAFPKVD